MTPDMYQGLFHLSSGALIFTLVLLIFRSLGERSSGASNNINVSEDSWLHMEELIISDIIEETHDIKTFRLKRSNKNFPEFKPGQFLSFVIGALEDKVARSYSLSCGDQNRSTISVSIKLLKEGVGSGWFHSRSIGDKVLAYPPSGHFSNKLDESKEQIFICGGIGVTPFVSMLESEIAKASNKNFSLFYGVRSTKDMAFHDQLELWSKRYKNFSYYPVLSSSSEEEWKGDKGYVSIDFIKNKIGEDLKSKSYYFCGPPVMTDAIMDALEASGVEDEKMFSEKFASPVSFDLSLVEGRAASIEYLGQHLVYDGKDTLLEFLEKNELPAKFACRVGVCGACKMKCGSGEVEQFTDTGLTRLDKKQGYILSCVSRPKADTKLKLT
jgi:ring-1,2-phenylacetyl-CoA epoxidase subunit PaaE